VRGVIWDLGNVIVDWDPFHAIAAGVGEAEARRFLDADDVDFMAYNHGPDSGDSWDDAEAALELSHPHWSGPSPAPARSSASCTPRASGSGA
jgi:2-haloacid dehalogenase